MSSLITEALPTPERARYFATLSHGSQAYNEEVPYVVHLESVVLVLKRFGFTEAVMECGGWLHDTIEDTGVNYNAILKKFGKEVAELVYAVTSELGRNRDERNAKTYPKIQGNAQATALKLADRIANLEYGIATGGDMLAKYRKEYPGFKHGIRMVDGEDPRTSRMWNHLDAILGYASQSPTA